MIGFTKADDANPLCGAGYSTRSKRLKLLQQYSKRSGRVNKPRPAQGNM